MPLLCEHQNQNWLRKVSMHIVILLCGCFCSILAHSETYYVTPKLDIPCPNNSNAVALPCMTLSQYANKPPGYFSANTTLVLLPGNHTLSQTLTLTGLSHLKIIGYMSLNVKSNTDVTVVVLCANNGVGFNVKNTDTAQVKDLTILGCRNNQLTSLKKFLLADSNVLGFGNKSSRINVENVTEVKIKEATFSRNIIFSNNESLNNLYSYAGAAVALVNVDFVEISECFFHKNSIAIKTASAIGINSTTIAIMKGYSFHGGALYVVECNLQVDNTTFKDNAALQHGGAVYAINSNISFSNCTMDYNKASDGGAIYADSSTNITIAKSTVNNNRALNGGALYIVGTLHIHNSSASNNTAAYQGGVIVSQVVKISNSTFQYNSAQCGGVISTSIFHTTTMIAIDTSHFDYNNASMTGGVILTSNAQAVSLNNSYFSYNTAENPHLHGAGVIYAQSSSNVLLSSSTFYKNSAKLDGGVIVLVTRCIARIYNSTFKSNSAYGAASIVAANWTSVIIDHSRFFNNTAYLNAGGVLYTYEYANITIKSSAFESNTGIRGGVCAAINTTTFTIFNSSFQYNRATSEFGGVIYIQLYCDITIEWSTFYSNTANGNQYGSGGVLTDMVLSTIRISNSNFHSNKAGYNGGVIMANGTTLTIHNCSFYNNKALGMGGVITSVNVNVSINSSTFFKNSAARAGILLLSSNQSSTVTIKNTEMSSNRAKMGGVLACNGSPNIQSTDIIIENVSLSSNSANLYGGIFYLQKCNLTSNGTLNMHNNKGSLFAIKSTIKIGGLASFWNGSSIQNFQVLSNTSRFVEAGAITLFYSVLYLYGNIALEYNQAVNGGAIYAIGSRIYSYGHMVISHNIAQNTGGAIYAYQSEISFSYNTIVADNFANASGGAIHVVGSTIMYTNGTHYIIDNTARENGGALFMELNSKLYIIKTIKESHNCTADSTHESDRDKCITDPTKWIRIEFSNNSAQRGGAIFVQDNTNSISCSSKYTDLYSSPTSECFFQILQLYFVLSSPPLTPIKNTHLTNNSALIAGENLYGGLLDRCTLSTLVEHYASMSMSNNNQVSYIQNVTNIQLDTISSLPVRVCFCDLARSTTKLNCSYQPAPFKVVKGRSITFSAVTVDQVNHTLPSTIHCSVSSSSGGLAEGQTRQNTSENCTELTYTMLSPKAFDSLTCYADQGPCNDLGISKHTIEVKFLPCPVGFSLTQSNSTCDCDPNIKPHITNCSVSTGLVLRKGTFWINSLTLGNSSNYSYVIYPHCPFDYCYPPNVPVWINLNSTEGVDRQCLYNHSGKLCGKCKTTFSLSFGSSHCRPCSNVWLLLIIVFAFAGIVLVIFLLVLNLTVAVGTINGLVLYANIVAANRDLYFPFERPNFITVFISWLNLDFGFETCFYNGMDAYAKTWLQFVFPLYIIFLVAAIIVISDYSPRFAILFTTGTNPIATLATLILLSYTKLLRTIISALSFTQINYPNASHEIVWLADANVPYLQGKHIPLFLAAVITAILGLVYTFFLFSWQWVTKYSKKIFLLKWMTNTKILAFMDAHHAPFNPEHRYWTGMLLLLRMLIYLVSAVNNLGDPRINLVAIICTMVILVIWHAIITQKPLKLYLLNLMELSTYLNLAIFTVLAFYFQVSLRNLTALAYLSTVIIFMTFVTIVMYHTYKFVLKKRLEKLKAFMNAHNFRLNACRPNDDTRDLLTIGSDYSEDETEVPCTEIAKPTIDSTSTSSDNEYEWSSESTSPQSSKTLIVSVHAEQSKDSIP